MKNIYIYGLLFISWINIYAQENIISSSNTVKITYEYSHSISEKTNFDTHLYCTESHSQYVYVREKNTIDLDEGMRYTAQFHKYINNYDFSTKKIEENRVLEDGTILYATWLNNLKWEITDEEKMLGNYKVRKAMTDSFELDSSDPFYSGKAIAWFCTDIPISSGPAKYYGLPGLILELEYENDGGTYVIKSIEGDEKYKFEQLDKTNLVDKNDVIRFYFRDPKKIKEIQKANKKLKRNTKSF